MTASDPVPFYTLRSPARWEGSGLHTGKFCRVVVHPAERFGIAFLARGAEIPAVAEHVSDTVRCTVLTKDGVSLGTVEHLLAALSGLGVWSAKIEVEGPELPILDGSAGPYAGGLQAAGLVRAGEVLPIAPSEGRLEEGAASRSWRPTDGPPEASFLLTGDHPLLSGQKATIALDDSAAFAKEVAPCRTWSPIEQVQALLDRNLIRGGSLENAVVVYPDHYSSPLRRPEEPARHKLLDLIGDLTLAGRPVYAKIAAAGGGHALNVKLAQTLRAASQRVAPEGMERGRRTSSQEEMHAEN